ncbi:MAG: flagellar motor protein MotB [Deltaproteobacteria bacterium]|nr:flagellar motor protein MotB [Deltaproteobacteria bacterium]
MAKKDKDIEYIKLPSREGWMITFSDMVTLLITFFVLLISMSSMDDKQFKEVFGFFNAAMGPLEFTGESEVGGLPTIEGPSITKLGLDTTSLSRNLLNALQEKGLSGASGRGISTFDVRETNRGLAVLLSDKALFNSGSAELKDSATAILSSVAEVIKDMDILISVEGHTDNLGDAEMNWKLSLDRAISVVDYFVFVSGMSPTRFCVAGYGPTRPVADNNTVQGRIKNRRVEVILLRDYI